MPNYGTKITKIVNGHRVMEYIEIVPSYKVTFTGEPDGITFQVGSDLFVRNQVGVFPDGTYPYIARVSGDTSYGEETGSFTVAGGDLTISETLTRNMYTLTIHAESLADTTLENVDVYINDKLIGKTDTSGNITYRVSGGSYNIIGRRDGFLPSTASITVTANRNLSIVLSELIQGTTGNPTDPPPPPGDGIASITSIPSGAEVSINGAVVGVTPMTKTLSPNTYRYAFKLNAHQDYVGTFRIDSNKVTSVSGALTPIYSSTSISFTATENSVQISNQNTGEVLGYTPVSANISGNQTHAFIARKEGYVDATFSIYAQAGQSYSHHFRMQRIMDYPPHGTIIDTYCQGFDKWGRYHNGTGGTYTQLIEANTVECGYPRNARVTIEDDVKSSTIYLYKNGLSVSPGAPQSELPSADFHFTKNASSIQVSLPTGNYTVVTVPSVSVTNAEDRILGGVVSRTAILNITDPTQSYYLRIINFKEILNRAFVRVETDIVNGSLTDYATRDTMGTCGWSVVSYGESFSIQPHINLNVIGNPGSSNGTHSIRTNVTYAKKYSSSSSFTQTTRANWNFSTIVGILPPGAVVRDASALASSLTATPGFLDNSWILNSTNSSVSFQYRNVNNSSRVFVEYNFTVTWWEKE